MDTDEANGNYYMNEMKMRRVRLVVQYDVWVEYREDDKDYSYAVLIIDPLEPENSKGARLQGKETSRQVFWSDEFKQVVDGVIPDA